MIPASPTPAPARRRRGERGSASIELVGLLPTVVVVALACMQLFAVVYAVMAANTAARHGARAYSMEQDADAAARAAVPSGVQVRSVRTFGPDHGVRVEVLVPTLRFLPEVPVSRSVEMP